MKTQKGIKKIEEVKKDIGAVETIKQEAPQQVNINDLPLEKLKSVAFDLNEQINGMRTQYNQIYQIIVKKTQEEKNNGNN